MARPPQDHLHCEGWLPKELTKMAAVHCHLLGCYPFLPFCPATWFEALVPSASHELLVVSPHTSASSRDFTQCCSYNKAFISDL